MFQKVKRNILLLLAASAVLYLVFTIYADFGSVVSAFANFNMLLIPLLLLLSCLTFTARYLKWEYYLHLLNIKIPKKDSFGIYMSSLIMLATPGALGEIFKSYLVKQITGDSISKTAPIVFAERTTDFIALIVIGLIGALIYEHGIFAIIIVSVIFLLLVLMISSKNFSYKLIDNFARIKFIKNYLSKINIAYESFHIMLKGFPLFSMILLSLTAWLFEFYAFYLILKNLAVDISFIWASFAYSFAMLAGSLTMIPGGLGITDGSLIFLITGVGAAKNIAVASTFIIRLVTLWFSVGVGAVFIVIYHYKFSNIQLE